MALKSGDGPSIGLTTGITGGGGPTWEFLKTPPTVSSNKLIISQLAGPNGLNQYLTTDSAFSVVPGGPVYRLVGTDPTKDLIIVLSGESGDHLNFPFFIQNWRNVYTISIPHTLLPPAGSGIGQLPGSGGTNGTVRIENASKHPRLNNGGIVYRVDIRGHFWHEGCYIDASNQNSGINNGVGIECDYMVHRGTAAGGNVITASGAQQNTWTVQNCRHEGNEGGTGLYEVHADYHQNQNAAGNNPDPRPVQKELNYDGFVGRSGQEGIVGHRGGANAGVANNARFALHLSRFNSNFNADNAGPSDPGAYGHHFDCSLSAPPILDRCYYQRENSTYSVFGNYNIPGGPNERITGANAPAPGFIIHPEVHWVGDGSSTPNWDLIPENLGYSFNSPHGVFY